MIRKPRRLIRSILLWFGIVLVAYVAALFVTYFGLDSGLSVGSRALISEGRAFLSNIVVSFILYYLVVYLPAQRKRATLRANCKKMYRDTKRQILCDIVSWSVSGGRTDLDMGNFDEMMKPEGFKKAFEGGREADEGFYAFTNFIMRDEAAFRSIVFKFKLVARQLEYILQNIEFDDEGIFQKLKRIEEGLFELEQLHADYDQVKILDNVIWGIFAGFSIIDGYRGFDFVEQAIDEI